MKKIFAFGMAGIAASALMLVAGYISGRPVTPAAASQQEPAIVKAAATVDRAEVEEIIRSYLLENPELLLEVQQALETKQQDEQRIAQVEIIDAMSDEIFNSAYDGIFGNPAGKYTLVEFFDYNCGYCKRAMADMEALTADDPDIRFVLKEFPILGPDSQRAHVVSMALRALLPEKYAEFHAKLLGGAARATEERAINIALALGADEAKLREEMKNPAIVEAFARTYDLANKLQITGTPSYVVGKEVVFGALGRQVLAEKVDALRACETATC
ncbi:thioredoxin domain-containing protein [Nitratireductor sp. CAU 1489]|uniref:Thioredoxin domain-containing protein n=1 Tax=Nitratireductor arenosus TaxID=2682096 RepID=A0A844QM25_9HYPH|nr:DsbA family protein [Nitratireductor arenosus]MVA99053.1 thioredoxin domain-containing protein [Nitratireductor arenosus]